MARPPLSMKPTGWFQVAWSAEVGIGEVHQMTYFGQDMVAWRTQSGRLTVMDAYCEHLGAHLLQALVHLRGRYRRVTFFRQGQHFDKRPSGRRARSSVLPADRA